MRDDEGGVEEAEEDGVDGEIGQGEGEGGDRRGCGGDGNGEDEEEETVEDRRRRRLGLRRVSGLDGTEVQEAGGWSRGVTVPASEAAPRGEGVGIPVPHSGGCG